MIFSTSFQTGSGIRTVSARRKKKDERKRKKKKGDIRFVGLDLDESKR